MPRRNHDRTKAVALSDTTRGPETRAPVELGVLALIWGSSFLFIKVGLEGLTPTQIVASRLLLGSVVLALAVQFGYAQFPEGLRQWRLVTLLAFMQNVLPFALFAWGEERISASLGSVLNATTPLFTAVIAAAAFLPGEQLDRRRGIALASGLAGVVVIMQPWRSGSGEVLGQLACLTAAACYGVGFVFTSRYITGRMHSTAAAVGQVMSGAVMATVIAAIATAVSGDTPHVDLHIVGAMLALGALGTGFAYLLVFRLMEAVGPTATSAVTFVMPIVGVLLGVVVLDERIGWNVAIGGVLVLVSIRFVRQKRALEAEGVAATS